MHELIGTLNEHYAGEILLAVGVLLVLVDYYFPTDVPCHFGYAAIALGVFLLTPLSLMLCLVCGIGAWALLELLHFMWLGKYLENAPSSENGDSDASEEAPA